MLLPLLGLLVGVLAGLVLNVNVGFELSRYSAVAILAALDSVLGAVRAELDGVYDNRIFISGFVVNAIVAVLLTFVGDRLGLDLYLVALLAFGLYLQPVSSDKPAQTARGASACAARTRVAFILSAAPGSACRRCSRSRSGSPDAGSAPCRRGRSAPWTASRSGRTGG